MSRNTVLLAGLGLYAALGVTDFVQTYALIEGGGGRVVEANPVAAEWLARHGWAGLAGYKAGLSLVVALVVGVLAKVRPPAAVLVVALGCGAQLAVSVHSGLMLAAPRRPDPVAEAPVPPPPAGARPKIARRLPAEDSPAGPVPRPATRS